MRVLTYRVPVLRIKEKVESERERMYQEIVNGILGIFENF